MKTISPGLLNPIENGLKVFLGCYNYYGDIPE